MYLVCFSHSFPIYVITEYWVKFPVLDIRSLQVIYFICCGCSVTKSCPTLCDPMDCSKPGFPVLQYLPECAQWCHPTISSSVARFSSCLESFPGSGAFPVSCIRWPKYWSFSISLSSEYFTCSHVYMMSFLPHPTIFEFSPSQDYLSSNGCALFHTQLQKENLEIFVQEQFRHCL